MRTVILMILGNLVSDHTLQGCHTTHELTDLMELMELKYAVGEVPNG